MNHLRHGLKCPTIARKTELFHFASVVKPTCTGMPYKKPTLWRMKTSSLLPAEPKQRNLHRSGFLLDSTGKQTHQNGSFQLRLYHLLRSHRVKDETAEPHNYKWLAPILGSEQWSIAFAKDNHVEKEHQAYRRSTREYQTQSRRPISFRKGDSQCRN